MLGSFWQSRARTTAAKDWGGGGELQGFAVQVYVVDSPSGATNLQKQNKRSKNPSWLLVHALIVEQELIAPNEANKCLIGCMFPVLGPLTKGNSVYACFFHGTNSYVICWTGKGPYPALSFGALAMDYLTQPLHQQNN